MFFRPAVQRFAAAAVFTLATVPSSAQVAPDRLDHRLNIAIEREHAAGRFDGVVVVGRGDAVVYRRAVGYADREKRQPHRIDRPWRLASVSKQVTALLVMRQVERGRVSLDAHLDALLPAFKSPLAAKVTIRQLLQHTSGLPNPDASLPADAAAGTVPPFYTATFVDEAGPLRAAMSYCAGPPAGQPGEHFSYNNCDTLVLQAVLERLTGESFSRLLAADVAAPLHLPSLGIAAAGAATPPPTPVGYLDAKRREPPFNLASYGASGAMMGTPLDLWRFDRALMQRRLLGDAATRTMWQGDPKLGYVALGAWSFEAPLAGCAKPVALVERRGEIGGIQVRNLIAPEAGAALIVFSNTAATDFGEIWQGKGLLHEMASAAFCAPEPPGSNRRRTERPVAVTRASRP